jgi:serine/threonine-protein kinase
VTTELPSQIDEYEVVAEIGRGGFGTVYEVRAADGTGPFALKLLRPELANNPNLVARFEREISAVRSLQHPGAASIIASGETPAPFFVMERLVGEELEARLARDGRLEPKDAFSILEELGSVLTAAHSLGIVHRDIKASNVFLCTDGRVVLLDFGVAKLLDGPEQSLTLSRQIVGTPAGRSCRCSRGCLRTWRTSLLHAHGSTGI